MGEFWRKEHFRDLATRQHGRITWAQMTAVGVPHATIGQWVNAGHLTRVLPKVYAVGHTAASREATLWEAVLYAGPGAAVSHLSAAHWRGLIKHPPAVVQVSTPREKIRSVAGVVHVFPERQVERTMHEGIAVTTIPQTLLDLARVEPPLLLPRALSVLDFRGQLDVEALEAVCGPGRLGSRALRAALEQYRPELAHTNGELEERFLRWCERWRVPLPKFNVRLHGITVDAYWPQPGLVVELDGYANHSSPAQLRRDRARDLVLRSHGLRVVRYDWALLHSEPAKVHADLMAQVGPVS
jgi:very-short-patch-repair endonuclease